jgi:hypothetical protein
MTGEQGIGKHLQRRGHGLMRYYLWLCLEELRKITRNRSQENRFPDRNSIRVPTEYKSEELTPWDSVLCALEYNSEVIPSNSRILGPHTGGYEELYLLWYSAV